MQIANSSPASVEKEKGLILIGAPRCGLSLLADCFRILGMNGGVQEIKNVVEFHRAFFQELGVNPLLADRMPEGWQDSSASRKVRSKIKALLVAFERTGKPWMIPDLFLCRVYPLWRDVIDELEVEPRFVHLLRHPWETARSLADVEKVDADTGYQIWLTYNREAASVRSDYPSMLITLDQLLADPLSVFSKVKSTLDLIYPCDLRAVYSRMLHSMRPGGKRFNVGAATPQDRSEHAEYFQFYNEFCALRLTAPVADKTANKKSKIHKIQAELNQLTQDLNEKISRLAETEKHLASVSRARDEQMKLASDRQAQIDQLKKALDEKAKQLADSQSQIDALTKSRNDQAKLATDRQIQIQNLTKDRDQKNKQLTERQAHVQQLTKTCDDQAKLATDRQIQIQNLTKDRDEKNKQLTERQAHVQQLTKTCDDQAKLINNLQGQKENLVKKSDEKAKQLSDMQDQFDQLKIVHDEQVTLVRERELQINKLETTLAETQQKNDQMSEEMIKVESQIEIIKEMLLQESEL